MIYENESEYFHQMDMEARYEAEMMAAAQAEAEYEAQMHKQIIIDINNLEQLIQQKEGEIEALKEEIYRLNKLL